MMLLSLAFVLIVAPLFIIFWVLINAFRSRSVAPSTFYNVRHRQLQEWTKKWGNFYRIPASRGFGFGLFNQTSQFVTSDPVVITELFGRELLPNFGARKGYVPAPGTGHVFIAHGQRWKELRKRVSVFSKHHLNSLMPLLHSSMDQMVTEISAGAKRGDPFDFRCLSLRLSASIIARTAFFTAFPTHHPTEHCPMQLVEIAEQLLLNKERGRLRNGDGGGNGGLWSTIFGHWNTRADAEERKAPPGDMFTEVVRECIAHAKAETDEKDTKCDGDDSHTDGEMATIVGNLFLDGSMKVVGIETVGHCLALVVHVLAEHLDVQHQLHLQLDGGDDPPMLMAVIRETLRLYPIVSFACSRECLADCVLKTNGVRIRAGDSVELDVFSMARNKAVWGPDAELFRPERWLDHSSLPNNWRDFWLPFGTGTRACIGIPLALALLKLAVVDVFRRFRITSEGKTLNLVGGDVLWPDKVMVRALIEEQNRTGDQ